ncbi:MAG: prepilin-type N-terminal cleavage/methylation domain-containing protein [Rubrivivax sp.]|nr:prepilin-type N-terminal cleavage/methylation domain-containing protein [Rubrivivax sp.]
MRRRSATSTRARGFTLVEVLVALFVMAVMAAMAWQGVDAVLRSRDSGRDMIDRSMLLATLMSQWETDLQSLHGDSGVPTLSFDGRSLRLVRSVDGGVQLVVWSLTDAAGGGHWQRWTSQAVTRVDDLQQAWLRSQQLQGNEPQQLRLLDKVSDWQLYFYRGNAWTNAQSSGDLAPPLDGAAGATGGAARSEQLPAAVRLVLQFDGKTLTRDVIVGSTS